jgi:hypothetical protein
MGYLKEKMSGDSESCCENSYTAKSAVAKANKIGPEAAPEAGLCNHRKHIDQCFPVAFGTQLSQLDPAGQHAVRSALLAEHHPGREA